MEIISDILPKVVLVTGIGTDVGKSYATGWLARKISEEGKSVITQKLIQTGNNEFSEDIEVHRRLMGVSLQPRDLDHTTAPIILSYPASPHLAAKLDNVAVDWNLAKQSTKLLSREFEFLLIEGAGGLMVPLTESMLTADYIVNEKLPSVLVTGGVLGSINHTLLSLSEIKRRGIKLAAVVYNPHFDNDKIIAEDTLGYLQSYVARHFPTAHFILMDSATI